MSIKWKLLLMVGLPVMAMVIIFGVGLTSFNVIDSDMGEVNTLHLDRATMIDADRDAYQAQVAVMEAVEAHSHDELKGARSAGEENMQQTLDRITGPAKNFTPDMDSDFNGFKQGFADWKKSNVSIFDISEQTLDANIERDKAEDAAVASFDSMRDVIDKLGSLLDEALQNNSLSIGRRMEIESALSMVLNADRDAYQAYVAQLLVKRAADIAMVDKLAASFAENVGQTRDRVYGGADILGGQGAAIKAEFITLFDSWQANSQKVVDLTKANIDKNIRKIELLEESSAGFSAMRDSIDKLGELEMKRVEKNLESLDSVISNTILVYVLVTIAFIIISVIATLIFSSKIAEAMRKSADVATALSEGDFSVNLEVDRNDEIGQMGMAMSNMINKLREIVLEVQDASSNVAGGSEQLASSAQTLSQGATEQASAVEEVSSSMEEMASSIGQNAETSVRTEGIARTAAEEGQHGGEAVRQTVEAMTQIAEKISIIEEIARQTNLLALNAAIEAARAGEMGKGFAVVAAEVRKLAERSGTAAQEISELSTSSVEVAKRAGEIIETIVPNIEETAELIQEISLASNEQNTGAAEVSSALQQLDSVVQTNASASEEIASTSEELAGLATSLEQTMAFFKLGVIKTSGQRATQTVVKPKSQPKAIAPAPPVGVALDMDDDDDSFERF